MNKEMKSRIYNLISKVLIFCLISFALVRNGISIKPLAADMLEMTVSYGLEDTARYGRTLMVYIEFKGVLTNMEGEVSITLARGGNKNNISYSKDISLSLGEVTNISIPVDLYSSYSDMLVVFTCREKDIRYEEAIQLNAYNFQKYVLCGILTDHPDKSFHQDFGSRTFYLNEENLPEDYKGLDMLDIIIMDEYDSSKLSEKQQKAVITWMENGGTLILAPNAGLGFKNDGSFIAKKDIYFDLNDDAERLYKLRSLVENYEREHLFSIQYNESIMNEASIPRLYLRYTGRAMMGSSLVREDNIMPVSRDVFEINDERAYVRLSDMGQAILVSRDFCDGLLVYSAIEVLNQNGDLVESTPVEAYFNYAILNSLSETQRLKLESEYSGFRLNNGFEVDILTKPDVNEVLSAKRIGIIIAVYLFIAIPAAIIILRHRRQTKYIWVMVPIISAAFTIFMYAYSSNARVKEPYFGYLDIKYYDNNKAKAHGSLDFMTGLNSNKAFSFRLQEAVRLNYSYDWIDGYFSSNYNYTKGGFDIPVDFDIYKTQIKYTDEGLDIMLDHIPAFQEVFYHADYKLDYELVAAGSIMLMEEDIEGRIVNYSNRTIQDSFIIADTLYIPIGDIKAGEEVILSKDDSVALISTEHAGYIGRYTSEEYKTMFADELRKISMTQKALTETIGKGAYYLIGFYEDLDENSPLNDVSSTDKSFGTSAVMITIGIDEAVNEEGVFINNIDTYLSFVSEENEYSSRRYMTSRTLTACYSFPKDKKVIKLVLTDLLNNIPSDSYYGIAEEVYLYNVYTKEYDLVFDMDNDTRRLSIDEEIMAYYIDEDNNILIRYHNTSIHSLCFLPIISCYMEVE